MPASSNWPPSASTSTKGTVPAASKARSVPAHKSGNRPKGPQEPKAHSAPELLHEKAAPALGNGGNLNGEPDHAKPPAPPPPPARHDHPGSTQAPREAPAERVALPPCLTGSCRPGFYQGAPGCKRCAELESHLRATFESQGGPDRGSIPVHPGSAQEPGPMPKAPGGVWPFGLSRLTAMAQARDRAGLEAFQAMRLPPKVGHYKAELLAWLDRVEAYEKSKPKHPHLK